MEQEVISVHLGVLEQFHFMVLYLRIKNAVHAGSHCFVDYLTDDTVSIA